MQVLIDADVDAAGDEAEFLLQLPGSGQHGGGVEHGLGFGQGGVDGEVGVLAGSPGLEQLLGAVPVGVAAGGKGLADACLAEANTDGVLAFYGVGELNEPAVFLGGDESVPTHGCPRSRCATGACSAAPGMGWRVQGWRRAGSRPRPRWGSRDALVDLVADLAATSR